jgi:hypothetical protein
MNKSAKVVLGRVLINAGIGRMSALGANRTRWDGGMTGMMLWMAPTLRSIRRRPHMTNVWSDHALQEDSSSWRMCGLASMYPA